MLIRNEHPTLSQEFWSSYYISFCYDSPNQMTTRTCVLAKDEQGWKAHHQHLIIMGLFETANYRKQLIKKKKTLNASIRSIQTTLRWFWYWAWQSIKTQRALWTISLAMEAGVANERNPIPWARAASLLSLCCSAPSSFRSVHLA